MNDATPTVVVANPYANQEVLEAAIALAYAGSLERYEVPLAVPSRLNRGQVKRTSTVSALAFAAAARVRLPPPAQFAVAEYHRQRFDRSVARHLRAADAVLAVQGSARATLSIARKRRSRAILNATLPEPGMVADMVEEESALRPDEARELLGDRPRGRWLERRAAELESADLILTPSTFGRQGYLAKGVAPERLAVTPLGVDLELFRPASEDPEPDRFRVVFVGRISQAKGVGYLVEAFGRIAFDGAELILVGDPTGARRSWRRAHGVTLVGAIPRHSLAAVLRSASVLVMPSLADSFGLVVLEAMASGLPAIVSRNSAGPDLITDGVDGYVVPIRDAEAIAARLAKLAADPSLRRQIGAAARSRAEQFPWSRYRKRILEVIRSD